jgi:hypothetical protein
MGKLSAPPKWTDPYFAMAEPHFNGATFQVFTTFTCLPEMEDSEGDIDKVTGVGFQPKGAGSASVMTGPSTVYRYYFYRHEDGEIGQRNRPINMLSKSPIRLDSGIVVCDTDEEFDGLRNSQFAWSDPDNYRVGVQRHCQVLFHRVSRTLQCIENSKQFVNLVFCSALNFSYLKKCHFTLEIARSLLAAEYRATILAACENASLFPDLPGSNILFLGLIGTDSNYCNPPALVAEAILSCRDLIEKSGLDIYVVCRSDRLFTAVEPTLRCLVTETDGEIIETRKASSEEELEGQSRWGGLGTTVMLVISVVGLVISFIWLFRQAGK